MAPTDDDEDGLGLAPHDVAQSDADQHGVAIPNPGEETKDQAYEQGEGDQDAAERDTKQVIQEPDAALGERGGRCRSAAGDFVAARIS